MTGYAVRCADFQTKPGRTREAAEHRLADIEAAGNCQQPHEVIEVEVPR